MNCPRCGSRTYVQNSRHADSTGYKINKSLLIIAENLISWYTRDWVVRRRVCHSENCDFDGVTIEMLASDIEDMMGQVLKGFGPFEEEEDYE